MVRKNVLGPVQVGNCARHLKNAIVRARAEIQVRDRHLEHLLRIVVQPAMLVHILRAHRGVAVHAARTLEPGLLHLPRLDHARADRRGRLPSLHGRKVLVAHRRHLDMNVNPVQQRTRNLVAISLNLNRRATALAFRIAVMAARARVHRRHEHEAARERHAGRRAGDGDQAVFQRLTHHLEHVAVKLRQLIQEQHSIVREAHLARHRMGSAPEQARVGYRVMGRTERPPSDQRLPRGQLAGDAVDFCRLERFLEIHRRQDGGHALGEHGFARAGRADGENIVPARHRDFERALRRLLSLHVAIVIVVDAVRIENRLHIHAMRGHYQLVRQEVRRLSQRLHRIHFEPVHHRGLLGVFLRHHDSAPALRARVDRDGQHAFRAAHFAAQRKLPHHA
ncbi:MAG: hypothetical protein BWY59_01664 [Verrucomicrobia bacterium ADurb.Bin345]|nr:MAG: hypothetical protein BWY59_01664 [Verrucomicrobia bacterium ADurb.Bin345]